MVLRFHIYGNSSTRSMTNKVLEQTNKDKSSEHEMLLFMLFVQNDLLKGKVK